MTTPHRIIIDADTGIDDALAIMYALNAPDIRVEGITTVFGNIDVEQATENTLRLIELCQPGYEVPVAKGAAAPLARDYDGPVAYVHGNNGVGDAVLAPSSQQIVPEHAAEFIIKQAHANPGEITLVMVGRMTNLSLALSKDPSIQDKFKEVVIMGGNVLAPGNVTPVSEANLHGDPEAAKHVFESELPLKIVTLDVSMKTLLRRSHLDVLERCAAPDRQKQIAFMKESMEIYFHFYHQSNNFVGACPLHDPLAVMVAVNPGLVRTQQFKATIDCGSGETAGMIVVDRRAKPNVGREMSFCMEVDAEQAVNQFMAVFV